MNKLYAIPVTVWFYVGSIWLYVGKVCVTYLPSSQRQFLACIRSLAASSAAWDDDSLISYLKENPTHHHCMWIKVHYFKLFYFNDMKCVRCNPQISTKEVPQNCSFQYHGSKQELVPVSFSGASPQHFCIGTKNLCCNFPMYVNGGAEAPFTYTFTRISTMNPHLKPSQPPLILTLAWSLDFALAFLVAWYL